MILFPRLNSTRFTASPRSWRESGQYHDPLIDLGALFVTVLAACRLSRASGSLQAVNRRQDRRICSGTTPDRIKPHNVVYEPLTFDRTIVVGSVPALGYAVHHDPRAL